MFHDVPRCFVLFFFFFFFVLWFFCHSLAGSLPMRLFFELKIAISLPVSAAGTHVSVRNAASLGKVPECLVSMVRVGGPKLAEVNVIPASLGYVRSE